MMTSVNFEFAVARRHFQNPAHRNTSRNSVAFLGAHRLDAANLLPPPPPPAAPSAPASWTTHTSGLADDHVQGNVVILPQALAGDFLRYCQRNPKPCPVLAVSEPGDPFCPTLGEDIDIRTDVPRYRVWRDGELVAEPTDITPPLAR